MIGFAARLYAWTLLSVASLPVQAVLLVQDLLCPADVHDVFPEEDR